MLAAILGTIGGILIGGVGGGSFKPMQGRWENYLTKADEERRNIRDGVQFSGGTGKGPTGQVGSAPTYSEPTYQQPTS